MERDKLVILDFGGTQSRAVARKVRGEQFYCEILPCDTPISEIRSCSPKGILLTGGAQDASRKEAVECAREVYELGVPILAMGYAARRMAVQLGGRLMGAAMEKRTAPFEPGEDVLFDELSESERYFGRLDVVELPEGFEPIAQSNGLISGFAHKEKRIYALQFEVEQNDPDGLRILDNFARQICECDPWWSMEAYVDQQLAQIRERVQDGSALLAISGGVDSSVCAALLHKAIGRRLHCVFVDTGFMRKGEPALIQQIFSDVMSMDLMVVNARGRFMNLLKGVAEPDEKRYLIGREIRKVLKEEAQKLGRVDYLVRGTTYSDVMEEAGLGIPQDGGGGLGILEPVRPLFKDEVRQVGEILGLPRQIVWRQPFPGAGLAVRCLGEVSEPRLNMLREADAILRQEIEEAGLEKRIWQYFAVLPEQKTLCYRDGAKTCEHTMVIRAVSSSDGLNANAVRMPYDLLERVVWRITNEVPGVGRVVYDITGCPSAAIEWW